MAAALGRLVYESFQFTLPDTLSDEIIKAQKHVHPDETPTRLVVPVFWVGSQHLTPAQLATMEASMRPFLEKPFEWYVSVLECSERGPFIQMNFEFVNVADKDRFFALRKHIHAQLKVVGANMAEADTPTKENSAGHCVSIGLYGNHFRAYTALDAFRHSPDRPKVGTRFQSRAFQLVRTDATVVHQW